jgi:hypothetical protein
MVPGSVGSWGHELGGEVGGERSCDLRNVWTGCIGGHLGAWGANACGAKRCVGIISDEVIRDEVM